MEFLEANKLALGHNETLSFDQLFILHIKHHTKLTLIKHQNKCLQDLQKAKKELSCYTGRWSPILAAVWPTLDIRKSNRAKLSNKPSTPFSSCTLHFSSNLNWGLYLGKKHLFFFNIPRSTKWRKRQQQTKWIDSHFHKTNLKSILKTFPTYCDLKCYLGSTLSFICSIKKLTPLKEQIALKWANPQNYFQKKDFP